MAWYTLFVMTGYEHAVASTISRSWRIDGLRPFVPMFDARFRKAGKVLSEKRRLIPGYIFIESELSGLDFYLQVKPHIVRTEKALKLLSYGDGHADSSFEMLEAEHSFLNEFLNNEQCVEMSHGYMKGTSVVVTDGPMVGHEGLIKKVNRHKMEATIEMFLLGSVREVTVGLEVVSKLA